MPLVTHSVVCTKKVLIARGVYELRFTKPKDFSFKPGQFILFDIPLIDPSSVLRIDDIQPRALSIASLPEENDLLFVVKLLPGGRMSTWIETVLHEGMSATFKGPFGNFILRDDQASSSLLFIATGAGIAPFRPMVLAAATANPARRIDVLFGVRSEDDLFWKDWMESASKKHPNVFHHIALSQPSPSWKGHKGRVQTVAPQVVGNEFAGRVLYVCGNPDMTNDVKRLALEEWGLQKKDLHVEGYI